MSRLSGFHFSCWRVIPKSEKIHTRCVSILASLWHAPSAKGAIGTATTGSSEAAQLGGLAMKKLWEQRRKAAGKSVYEPGWVVIILEKKYKRWSPLSPNIVTGANAQVARYFDVECRFCRKQIQIGPKEGYGICWWNYHWGIRHPWQYVWSFCFVVIFCDRTI